VVIREIVRISISRKVRKGSAGKGEDEKVVRHGGHREGVGKGFLCAGVAKDLTVERKCQEKGRGV